MTLVDDDTVAHDTNVARALDLTVLHIAAGNRADRGDLVGLADLGVADDGLAELRREHTLHSSLDLVDRIVNDAVHTHIDMVAGRAVARRSVGTDVEADDDGIRGGGKHNVALVDRADRAVNDAHANFVVGDLFKRRLDRFDRAHDVRLDDEVEVLHLARLDLAEEIFERDLRDGGVGLALFLFLALLHELAGKALVGDGIEVRAGLGHFAKTRDLHRHAGAGGRELLTLVAHHRAHAADGRTGDDDVALMERTVLDEERCDGAAALVKARLDHSTGRGAVGVRLELGDLCRERDHFQQVVNAHTGLGGDGADNGVAAPVFGHKAVLGQLLLDALGVCVGLIHLVDGNDDGDLGGLGVVDGLDGLRLDAVLRRNDEDRNIRDHRAAGTHGGKGLMARGIEEGDGLALDLHLIGADVLGNAAGLAGGNVCVADIVEKARLAVVDVTHDNDDRRAGLELVGAVLVIVDELFLDRDDNFLFDLAAELLGNEGRGVEVDHLGEGSHHAVFHQALDDLRAGLLHTARQLADGDLIGDLDGQRGLLGDLKLETAHLLGLFLLALAGKRLLAVVAVSVVAELLLAAALQVAAIAGALSHVLELLVVLVKVDVRDLAGVDDLLFRHARRGMLRGGGLALLLHRLGVLLRLGGLTLLALLGLGTAAAIVLLRGRAVCLRLILRTRALFLRLLLGRGLGIDRLDLHLILLRQMFEDQVDLIGRQHLRRLLAPVFIGTQNGQNVLRRHAEVLCQIGYLVLVHCSSQITAPPCVVISAYCLS